MARYIDADELKAKIQKNISDYYWSDGGGYYLAEDAVEEIDLAETADVALKSEVAREIFADIEKFTYRYLNDVDYAGSDLIYDLAELKKKYIGE